VIEDREVREARIEAAEAQERLIDRLHELQQRIAPKTLARDAWEGAKSKGADLAEEAVDAVRKRPIATTGVVAALAMFLAREPLLDLAGKLVNGNGKKARKKTKARKSADKMESVNE
jgi:hypothetical protein